MKEGPKGIYDIRAETLERLGPYVFIQKKTGQRLTQDSVLLADFLPALREDDRVIDLGTGTGALLSLLAWKTPALNITGVEIDEGAAGTAKKNIEANSLQARVSVITGDWRELPRMYPEGSFSVVLSNPPYVKAGAGRISPVRERAMARSEANGGLPELLKVSAHLAGGHGCIFYVFPYSRYDEMLAELKKAGLEARRVSIARALPERPPKLFLIEAQKAPPDDMLRIWTSPSPF